MQVKPEMTRVFAGDLAVGQRMRMPRENTVVTVDRVTATMGRYESAYHVYGTTDGGEKRMFTVDSRESIGHLLVGERLEKPREW